MFSLDNIRALFDSSPNAYLVMLPDAPRFTIAEANKAFLDASNSVYQDIVGKGLFEVFPENSGTEASKGMKTIRAAMEHCILLKKRQRGVLQRYDVEVAGKFEVRFWSFEIFPLLDKNNEVMFIVQNAVDITTSISAEKREHFLNEQLIDPLNQNSSDAIYSLDLEGNFLSANQAVLDLAECSRDELLRSSFVSFMPSEDFEKAFSHFQKAMRGTVQNFYTNIIGAKGTRRIIDVTTIPIIVNKGIIGVHCIAKDVTALKQAETKLDEYHKRISNILESITDGFLAVDRNWTVRYWNKEAERILSMKRQNVMGRNLWDVYQDAIPLKFYKEYHKALAENVSVRFDEYFPPLQIWLEVSAFPSAQGLSVYFRDITQRKEADERLKRENDKYRDLFNLSPIPKWVYDIKTLRFLDVNESAITQYGYSREEFLSMTLIDIWLPEDKPILDELLQNRLNQEKFSSSSIRHRKKSSEIIFVTTKSNRILFNGIESQLILAIDVTEKLKAEQRLEASERRFKSLVQDGSDLIAILDENANYKYVSPTSKSVLGIKAEFFIGKNAFDFIHDDDKERVLAQLALSTDRKRVKIDPFRFLDSKKRFRWIETIVTNMIGDPVVAGIIANSRDVTDRINDEMQIKETIGRYNVVSKATSDAIWDWDIASGKILWNKGIKGIFGFKDLIYTEEWWCQQIHPEDIERVMSDIQAVIRLKRSKLSREYRFRCADGNYKYVLDRAFLLFNDSGEPVRMIGAMQDITERVNRTRAIIEQNQRLRKITWTQSHLVRGPLSRIMGLTTLLCDEKVEDSYKDELVSYLKQSAEDLDAVIHDIIKIRDE